MMIGVKGKQLCAGNPNADGQMEGQTDGRTDGHGDYSIPPLTSLRGGYNNLPVVQLLYVLSRMLNFKIKGGAISVCLLFL